MPTYPHAACGPAKVALCERRQGSVWRNSSINGNEGYRHERGAPEKIHNSGDALMLVAGTRPNQEIFGAWFEML